MAFPGIDLKAPNRGFAMMCWIRQGFCVDLEMQFGGSQVLSEPFPAFFLNAYSFSSCLFFAFVLTTQLCVHEGKG